MVESSELSSALEEVLEERAYASDTGYYDGCAAALEWLIRSGSGRAPVSGNSSEPKAEAELRQAIAMLHGEEPPTHPRAYLSGVEGTLAWALGQTEEPPL